jgi:hypothetical protein
MKFHTPFFIIGIVLVVLPATGIPDYLKDISIMVFGFALIILSASANFSKYRNKIDMLEIDMDNDQDSDDLESSEENY